MYHQGVLAAPRHPPAAWPLTWVHLAVSQLYLPLGLHHVEGQRQHRSHLQGQQPGVSWDLTVSAHCRLCHHLLALSQPHPLLPMGAIPPMHS